MTFFRNARLKKLVSWLLSTTQLAGLSQMILPPQVANAGAGTITVLDSGSVTRTYDVITDGSGHFVSLTGIADGTDASNLAAVKAASTAAGATDPSLVVAISPNSRTVAANQSGTWTVGANQSGTWYANQSGTWIISLPTGASTAANQTAEIAALQAIQSNTSSAIPAGSALIGGTYLVDSGGTNKASVGSAGQQLVNLGYLSNTTLSIGQSNATASIPVVLPSNQTVADPCTFQAKTNLAVSTNATTVSLITGSSGKKVYICSGLLISSVAASVNLIEGSTSTCSANTGTLIGTNGTASLGPAFAANGGFTLGNGAGTVAVTANSSSTVCLFQSGGAQIAGNLTYVQQ